MGSGDSSCALDGTVAELDAQRLTAKDRPVRRADTAARPSASPHHHIGLSLGGPTGYAINPARDLGPRLAHAVLPVAGKGSSDWSYAWIPIVGPIVGGVLGALSYRLLWTT